MCVCFFPTGVCPRTWLQSAANRPLKKYPPRGLATHPGAPLRPLLQLRPYPRSRRVLPPPRRTPWPAARIPCKRTALDDYNRASSSAGRLQPGNKAAAHGCEPRPQATLGNRRRGAPLLHRRAPCATSDLRAGIELRNNECPFVQAAK
jgi:hypothetical protein